jgi:hypothetical protein
MQDRVEFLSFTGVLRLLGALSETQNQPCVEDPSLAHELWLSRIAHEEEVGLLPGIPLY